MSTLEDKIRAVMEMDMGGDSPNPMTRPTPKPKSDSPLMSKGSAGAKSKEDTTTKKEKEKEEEEEEEEEPKFVGGHDEHINDKNNESMISSEKNDSNESTMIYNQIRKTANSENKIKMKTNKTQQETSLKTTLPSQNKVSSIQTPKNEKSTVSRPTKTRDSIGGTNKSKSSLYEREMIKKAALEKRREEARKKDCSFSPQLVSSKKLRSRATTPGKKRHETLYEDAQKRKLDQEKLKAAQKLEECTFTPKTNNYKGGKRTPGGKERSRGMSPARRAENLYANAKTLEQKKKLLAQERLKQESEQFSFKPKITAKARKARPDSPGVNARMDEMYRMHKEKEKRLLAAKKQRETQGCTFQPKINQKRRVSTGTVAPPSAKSVQDRLLMYQKTTERKRQELAKQLKAEEEASHPFKPNIHKPVSPPSASSQNGDRAKAPSSGSIHERLYHEAETRESRQQKLESMAKDTNPRRQRPSSAPRGRSSGSEGLFDRLSVPKKVLCTDDLEEQRAISELKECTFQPKVRTSLGGRGTGGVTGYDKSVGAPLWDRLHKESMGVQEMREELKRAQELQDCTFKPKVSTKRSPTNTTSQPIWDRLNEEARQIKEKLKQKELEKNRKELESCTFRPSTQERSSSSSASSSPSAGVNSKPIWDRLSDPQMLAKKQEELEKKREQAELAGCTFKPVVSPTKKTPRTSPTSATRPTSSYLEKIAKMSAQKSANKAKAISSVKKQPTKKKKKKKDEVKTTTPMKFSAAPPPPSPTPLSSSGVPSLDQNPQRAQAQSIPSNSPTSSSVSSPANKAAVPSFQRADSNGSTHSSLEARIAQAMAVSTQGLKEEAEKERNQKAQRQSPAPGSPERSPPSAPASGEEDSSMFLDQ